ncbi:MAG: putative zinc-finger [Chthonomonadaceae bacterium]|nr:putative zinc-finger [Chthonomonadaceae bacterium]
MQCKQAQELFSEHIAGQLDPALSVSLENHARSCDACRAEIAGLRRVWTSLDALPSVEPPSFFHENLMHRINMEQDKAAEAAQRQRAGWNWRSLFLPRSPIFAGAAVALLALIGMGGLHVQHASLDPLGAVWGLLSHDKASTTSAVPALQAARAEWHPNGQGGGTLSLYLQAQQGPLVSIRTLNYHTGQQKRAVAESDMVISADHETTLSIPLDARPTSDLSLSLNIPGGGSVTAPVTLMEPVSAPSSDH